MAALSSLEEAWTGGPDDRLCAREQAKAWALREIWREEGKENYGLLAFVASKLKKNLKGKPQGGPPTKQSLHEFFAKVDDDPSWFPGKHIAGTRGPKRVLRGGSF